MSFRMHRGSRTVLAYLALVLGATPLAADEPSGDSKQGVVETVDGKATFVADDGAVFQLKPSGESVQFVADGRYLVQTVFAGANQGLGVDATPVDIALRTQLGLAENRGVLVNSVVADGPAAKAGVQTYDVLIKVADAEIEGLEGLQKLIAESADKPIRITLIRAGKELSLEVVPVAKPLAEVTFQPMEVQGQAIYALTSDVELGYWLGVGLSAADDTLRSHLDLPAGEGLVVTSVEADSPATTAGVMTNDLLLKLDGKALATIEGLSAQLQEIGEKSVTLNLLRHGKPAEFAVKPMRRPSASIHYNLAVARTGELLEFAAQDLTAVIAPDRRNIEIANLVLTGRQDPAQQVAALMEQVKQLQASLESLQASLKAQQPGAQQPGADTPPPGENK